MKRGRKRKKTEGTEQALIRFGISIPADLLEKFDDYCSERKKANRSDAIRDLIRDKLVEQQVTDGKGEQVATVTLVYDGQGAEIQRALAESKRGLGGHLLSCLHVPLGARLQMEVLAMRGPGGAIRNEAENVRALKGILHGKVVCTTPTTP